MKSFNTKRYNTLKGSIKRSGVALQNNTQELLEMGGDHFMNNKEKDTQKLTDAVRTCIGVKGLDTKQCVNYCEAVFPVKYTRIKTKSGHVEWVFKVDKKREFAVNKDITKPWYEFEKEAKDKQTKTHGERWNAWSKDASVADLLKIKEDIEQRLREDAQCIQAVA